MSAQSEKAMDCVADALIKEYEIEELRRQITRVPQKASNVFVTRASLAEAVQVTDGQCIENLPYWAKDRLYFAKSPYSQEKLFFAEENDNVRIFWGDWIVRRNDWSVETMGEEEFNSKFVSIANILAKSEG